MSSSAQSPPSEGDDQSINPPRPPPITVPVHLKIPLRIPQLKVNQISHREGKFVQTSPTGKTKVVSPEQLPSKVRAPVENLREGESLMYGYGKVRGDTTYRLSQIESTAAKMKLKLTQASAGIVQVDQLATVWDKLDEGLSIAQAIASLPSAYYEAAAETAKQAYDAVVSQDLVRLGKVVADVADPTTPVVRLIDKIGETAGIGKIGSQFRYIYKPDVAQAVENTVIPVSFQRKPISEFFNDADREAAFRKGYKDWAMQKAKQLQLTQPTQEEENESQRRNSN